MRSADATTIFRALFAIFVVYLIILKINPFLIAILIAFVMLLDAVDGFFAVWEASKGAVGPVTYIKYAIGNKNAVARVKKLKHALAANSAHGARMDVAGDRVVEYSFWIIYTYLHILPLFVLLMVVVRHSFVDAIMANKGTSSKMKTKFAQIMYSSSSGRGGINVLKFVTFSYLAFVYIAYAPLWIGYLLTAALLLYIMLRGIAEVIENM